MEEKNQPNSMEMSGCIDFKLDMGSELNKMYEVLNKDQTLHTLLASAVNNFMAMMNDLPAETKQDEVFICLCCGYILNDVYKRIQKGSGLKNILEARKDDLVCYKAKLEDGNEFVVSLSDEMMLDNNFINHLQKQMGKKIVSKFVKMDKEEADKLHNALIKKCTGEENA